MDKLSARQRAAVFLLALTGPVLVWSARCAYPEAAAAFALASALYAGFSRLRGTDTRDYAALCLQCCGETLGRVLLGLSVLWLLAAAARSAAACEWLYGRTAPFPAIAILTWGAAVWAAGRGEAVAGRALCVVFPFCAAVLVGLLALAVPELHGRFLRPQFSLRRSAGALLPCLLLSLRQYFPQLQRPALHGRWYAAAAALFLLPSVAAAGVISPEIAAQSVFPLLTAAQSVSLFGVVERFEAILSAVANAAFFALLTLFAAALLRQLHALWPQLSQKAAQGGLFAAGAALACIVPPLPAAVYGIGAVLFWAVLPAALLLLARKKRPKSKNFS